jgi:hypothetical protein
MDLLDSYSLGENIQGSLILKLKPGEVIPADSVLKISLGNQKKEIPLIPILNSYNLTKTSGDYYLNNQKLTGEGYGFVGEKKIYPEIDFTLLINQRILSNNPQINLTNNQESNPKSDIASDLEGIVVQETPASEENQEASLASDLIKEEKIKEIKGSVSKINPFTYTLKENEEAELLKGSVKENGES